MGALSAAELGAYQLLAAGVTLAAVFSDVPENTQPPVVIIGDLSAERGGGKGDRDKALELSIVTIVSGTERTPVFAIHEQIEAALDDVAVTREGWALRFLYRSDDVVLASDGEGYVGTCRYAIIAEPA